jgi:hypothetical protein
LLEIFKGEFAVIYVQIILRNAAMYRQLYGDTAKATTVSAALRAH